MRLLVFGLVLCAHGMFAQAGPYWALGFGGQADDRVVAVAKGPGISQYICGTFNGVLNYPGGAVSSVGASDVFLAKLDTAGHVLWLRTAGGPGPDRCTDLAVNSAGDVAITGQFTAEIVFDGSLVNSNGPSQDMFVARYAANGTFQWARSAGSTEHADIGEHVALTSSGAVFVAGSFSHAALFGSNTITSTVDAQTLQPGIDMFLASYAPDGTLAWVRHGQADGTDRAAGLAVSESGECWLAGQFSSAITFDQPHPNGFNNAGFLSAFDATGAEQWFVRIGGGASLRLGDLHEQNDTLWLAGAQTGNNLVFANPAQPIASPYANSAFVLAFSSGGELLDRTTLGSEHDVHVSAIDVHDGVVLLAGDFSCQFTELSLRHGGDGLFISWGPSNGWACAMPTSSLEENYAQMLGCRGSMSLLDAMLGADGRIHAAGQFTQELILPSQEDNMRAVPGDSIFRINSMNDGTVCADSTYYDAAVLEGRGGLDGFFTNGFIPGRAPMDIFPRSGCEFSFAADYVITTNEVQLCTVPGTEVAFCQGGSLLAAFNFSNGPVGLTTWGDGLIANDRQVNSAGTYTASSALGSGCFLFSDTIEVGICEQPWLGGITDDLGINTEDTITTAITLCEPSTVTLTAGPLTGSSFQWVHEPGTVITDQTFEVPFAGAWELQVTNDAGCTSSTPVFVDYIPNAPLGEVDAALTLTFPQDVDGNDTITICEHELIFFRFGASISMDGIELSNAGSYNVLDTVYAEPGGVVYLGGFQDLPGEDGSGALFQGTGWYVFDLHVSVDDRPCHDNEANFNRFDSIYVVGLDGSLGQVDILGPIHQCAGENVLLEAQANAPGTFEWQASNGGIIGDINGASIELSIAGPVTVNFYPLDTGACVSGASDVHSVQFVPPPSISMDPLNGLICPGEDVQLSVSGASGTYAWFGPNGPLSANTASIGVDVPGDYFCVATTIQGCIYTTDLRTVELYAIPYGEVSPQPVLCEGGSVQVLIQPAQDATYTWAAPLTGVGPAQTIDQPGVYSCSVSRCGQTTEVVFTVTQSTFATGIVDPGPFILCGQDSAVLQANPGGAAYVWQPGGHVGEQVHVTEPGEYRVIAYDALGCADSAGTAVVTAYAFAEPLVASVPSTCADEPVLATATGSGAISWFTDEALSQLLANGASALLTAPQPGDVLYVVQAEGPCISSPLVLPIEVSVGPPPPVITGDPVICSGEESVLAVEGGGSAFWSGPAGVFEGSILTIGAGSPGIEGSYAVYVADTACTSDTTWVIVEVRSTVPVDLGPDQLVCAGEAIALEGPAAAAWIWSTGSEERVIAVDGPGTYWLQVEDEEGCIGGDTVVVELTDCELVVPNVITPNGDGVHDVISLRSPSEEPLTLEVRNRWGQLMWSRTGLVVEWDGYNGTTAEPMVEGVYFFTLWISSPNTTMETRTGYIHLIR